MAEVSLRVKMKGGLLDSLKGALNRVIGRSVKDNAEKLRPIIKKTINDAVKDTKDNFIPTDQEAFELGVGAGGSIDTTRTEGAWRQLMVDTENSSTTLDLQKGRGRINLSIDVDEDKFLGSPLSNVPTPDSKRIESIPWMDWLLNGAPTNNQFRFQGTFGPRANSRTGGGIMAKGGLWSFPPARPFAFQALESTIERRVIKAIEKNGGEIIT